MVFIDLLLVLDACFMYSGLVILSKAVGRLSCHR